MQDTESPAEQARTILEVIRTFGLELCVPPEPLPEIRPEEIHLVTWLALTP